MRTLSFSPNAERGLRVLALGAHSDDVEIGAGGTILSLLDARDDVHVTWVVFSGSRQRADEARASAERFLAGAATSEIILHDFRDGFFPHEGAAIKERFEDLKRVDPDVILTHRGRDWHQDHRTVSELTWNTFRRHTVLEYEIPKYDGDLESPNVFVPISDEHRNAKVDLLMEMFGTQRSKSWFTPETFDGLMRLRGIECASPTGYAEGFHARKITVEPA
jgi:LmbE family N-acetylglucosaminyl deacetylase